MCIRDRFQIRLLRGVELPRHDEPPPFGPPPALQKRPCSEQQVQSLVVADETEEKHVAQRRVQPQPSARLGTCLLYTSYREEPAIDRIAATIYVSRESQKGILIGHKGEKLKRVGQAAREDMEQFLQKKVFLQLFVKVSEDWRNDCLLYTSLCALRGESSRILHTASRRKCVHLRRRKQRHSLLTNFIDVYKRQT